MGISINTERIRQFVPDTAFKNFENGFHTALLRHDIELAKLLAVFYIYGNILPSISI